MELLGRVDGGGALHVDPSWVNSWGVVFGGVAVAALLDSWAGDAGGDVDVAAVHLAFAKPVSGEHPVEIRTSTRPPSGRVLDGSVHQGDVTAVEGFAVTAPPSGPTVAVGTPDVPDPDGVPEATDRRTAAFIDHHFELRVVPTRRPGRGTVHQWVRFRNLAGDRPPPPAAIGLLADLASVGVFRTAAKHLDGPHAVLALDLALELTGRPPTEWTLMALTVPPIHGGTAIARAELYDVDRRPVATAVQHTVVRPLPN